MTDIHLAALPRTGAAGAIWRLIGKWRAGAKRPRMIDPDALTDHLQRDLGFRDGRSTPASIARAAADRPAWR